MSDLISRGRARHEFAKFFQDSKSLVDDCDSLLCMLPTIDAVPVVRCKDCKNWMYECDDVGLCVTDVPDIDGVERYADDFCSNGERKDDEH